MKVADKVAGFLKKIEKEDKKINSFLHINKNALKEAKALDSKKSKGKLYGYVFGVKSNINVLGMHVNCASKVLEDYIAPYDASAVAKIKAEDGLIIGMTNMDEFALGGSGEKSAFGATGNPNAPGYISGGSSSGSAAAVAAGFCDVALGSDTGGSCRNPGSLCGVVGLKPSYGRVSRYGLIDSAMSFDQIGILAKNVEDANKVLSVISGIDDKDTTTAGFGKLNFDLPKKVKIGRLVVSGIDGRIQELIDKKVSAIAKKNGWSVEDVKIGGIDLAVQTYYVIQYAEFFSASRRFDGRRFGKKIDEFGGEEVIRRILGGSEITKAEFAGKYYQKALIAKAKIAEEFAKAFKKFDAIVFPTVPRLPWKIGQGQKMKPEEEYAYDALTVPANLAGICAISIPSGKIEGIPIGLQVMCAPGEDGKLLSIAGKFEI